MPSFFLRSIFSACFQLRHIPSALYYEHSRGHHTLSPLLPDPKCLLSLLKVNLSATAKSSPLKKKHTIKPIAGVLNSTAPQFSCLSGPIKLTAGWLALLFLPNHTGGLMPPSYYVALYCWYAIGTDSRILIL